MKETTARRALDLYSNTCTVPSTDNLFQDHIVFDFANVPCSASPLDEINLNQDTVCHTNSPERRPIGNRAGTKSCANKTTSRCVQKDIRGRRITASIRERRRLQVLSDALHTLRSVVPDARMKERVTKLEILRMASRYIFQLRQALAEKTRNDNQAENELKSCLFANPVDANNSVCAYFDNQCERERYDGLGSQTTEIFFNSTPDVDSHGVDFIELRG